MITFTGMSTSLALQIVDRVKDQQIESIENTKRNALEIENFREQVDSISSVDEFVDNYDVYSFMMKAYDLEEKIYAKALMKEILKSDLDDPNSLGNRIQDPKIRELARAIQFENGGETNPNTNSLEWAEEQVDVYLNTQFINQNGESNEALGVVLKFRDKVEDVSTWFSILGDRDLSDFMRTALGVPFQTATLDIDRQAEILGARFDLEDLQDPEKVEQLINRYVIYKDAETNQNAAASSPILQLVGPTSGQFVPITIGVDMVAGFSASAYR